MLILKTEVHETIWGGKKLAPYSEGSSKKIGHLYSVNCNENESNIILNGTYAGRTLNEYFNDNKKSYGLDDYDYFPLIIALVEAKDNLSIQVHPDDETAPVLNPKIKRGKNESWFFIDAPEQGWIYDGCLCSDMKVLRQNISSNNMEKVTGRLNVKAGDYVYIEAGTLHAMTSGSLVYEIEENAGCTYRFYDYDRLDENGKKRPLQIPEAFYSIHLGNKSKVKHYCENPLEERRYITQHYDNINNYKNHSNTLQAVTFLSGEYDIEGIKVIKGMSVILEPNEALQIENAEIIVAQPKPL